MTMIKFIYKFSNQPKAESQLVRVQSGIFNTNYGPLKMIRNPFTKQDKINQIYYLVDGVGSNFVRSLFKNEKSALIVFDAQKMHYQNAFELYYGSKKALHEMYYGTIKKPKDIFKSCKSPKDIYHLQRKIKHEQKTFLYRICLIMARNGELRIQGNYPSAGNLKYFADEQQKNISDVGFIKHDYLIPFSVYQGLVSAYQYEIEGIEIEQLDNKKIYCLYGVWPPTQKQYLQLMVKYLEKLSQSHDVQKNKKLNIIDIGCGTGILGFLVNKYINKKESYIYGIDNVENAIKSAKINSQSLGVTNYRAEEIDLLGKDLEFQLRDNKFPQHYDLIVANPPWIQASKLQIDDPLENTTSDPDGKFLEGVFIFSQKYMQVENFESSSGRLILVYSDLSQILGLQPTNHIQKLCEKYKMKITYKDDLPFTIKADEDDPLQKYKQQSKVQIFEIKQI